MPSDNIRIMHIDDDIPVCNLNQDELGRDKLVRLISRAIEDRMKDSHHAVTIGVYGAWGEGKTSLMKMVKTELETNGYKSSWYNPWSVNDERKLLMDFFSILSSAAFDDNGVKVAIENYGNTFLMANDAIAYNPVTASYLTRLSRCIPSEGKDIEKLKKSISDRLIAKNRHPIIFIDDTDRLNIHEIRTVFKLIRQIADFENVIYVIGLDPAAVSGSLELTTSSGDIKDNYSKGRAFLEKVIQIPIVLPVVDDAIIQKLIKKTIIGVADEFKIKVDRKGVGLIAETLSNVLTTKRSIIRFGNQLRFVLPSIYEETELVDLCLVESLKYLNEQGWLEIYRHKNNLLGEIPLYIISDSEIAKYRKESYDSSIQTITSYYPAESRKYVEEVLKTRLFPERHEKIKRNSSSKAINNKIYFGQYFIAGVPDGIIPRIEANLFARLVQTNQKKAISWINQMSLKYSSDEVDRSARLSLNIVGEKNVANTAAKLCVVLSLSNLAHNYSKNLVSNPTSIDLTITLNIIPRYFMRNVQGVRVQDNELVTEVLKEIFNKAPLNYCLNLLYGVYSGDCLLPDDEKGVFDVLKLRVIELGDLAIFDYSYYIIQRFLKTWKDTNKYDYTTYINHVLNNEKFNAGSFVVSSLEAVSDNNQLTTITEITYLFMDVWENFNDKLSEYKDKENKFFKLFVFNCETSRKNLFISS